MREAIKYDELLALVEEYKRGKFVDAKPFLTAVKGCMCRVGSFYINNLDDATTAETVIKTGERNIKGTHCYVSSKEKLAKLFGVNRKTVANWGSVGAVTLTKVRPPASKPLQKTPLCYDAAQVLCELKEYFKKSKIEDKNGHSRTRN